MTGDATDGTAECIGGPHDGERFAVPAFAAVHGRMYFAIPDCTRCITSEPEIRPIIERQHVHAYRFAHFRTELHYEGVTVK